MRLPSDSHQKMMSAYQLLQGGTISINTFEQIRSLLKGIHPKIDAKLESCSHALQTLQKLQSGDIITLTAEHLPEDTQERKKKKKALLFFISSIHNLKSEIKRIDSEFTHAKNAGNSYANQITAWGRILAFAKGPLGIVTLIALISVGFVLIQRGHTKPPVFPLSVSPTPTVASPASVKIQIILYNGKQIPLNQLYIGHGSDCDNPHYHAVTGTVTTLDQTVIPDPENCGYGKVKDVQVTEITITASPGK